MSTRNRLTRTVLYLWALPTSLVGLAVFLACRLGGARLMLREGILEAHGPGIRRLFTSLPAPIPVQAITFGHVVLGRDRESLERTRVHERAHVEQCQRWGPAFLPAYLLASLWVWARGGDAYWDNPFERQARAAESRDSGSR